MKPDMKNQEGAGDSSLEPSQEVPDFRIIPVALTFDGYPPFKFKFKRQQSEEVKAEKQAFYAQTDEEQKDTLKSYRVNILAKLLTEKPTGVFGYPETEGAELSVAFLEFFNSEDNDDLLQWIWSQYQEKLYPKELLSSPLE